jgi:hypothetical protein
MIERWREWTRAFDTCCDDDQWDRLTSFLTEDVVYAVTGAPFACEIRGREEVIAGFAKSIRNFDRRFDERRWYGVGIRSFAPNGITGRATGCYLLGDHPPITFSAQSLWLFRGDRLSLMTDVYDTEECDVQLTLHRLAELGLADADPSYA